MQYHELQYNILDPKEKFTQNGASDSNKTNHSTTTDNCPLASSAESIIGPSQNSSQINSSQNSTCIIEVNKASSNLPSEGHAHGSVNSANSNSLAGDQIFFDDSYLSQMPNGTSDQLGYCLEDGYRLEYIAEILDSNDTEASRG